MKNYCTTVSDWEIKVFPHLPYSSLVLLSLIAYRSSRSAHARDLAAGGRKLEVEGDGSRVVFAIEI